MTDFHKATVSAFDPLRACFSHYTQSFVMRCHGPAASGGLFWEEKYFQRTFHSFCVGVTVMQLRKRPKTRTSPAQSWGISEGSLLRLRSIMRLEVHADAWEWHLRGNEGHDGLITVSYRSSHSCGYATAAGQFFNNAINSVESTTS